MNAEDDGYVTPEFDLPLASAFESSEHDDDAPLQKRQKPSRKTREDSDLQESRPMALVDEVALALALLSGQNHRSRPSSPVQRPMRHTRVPICFTTMFSLRRSIICGFQSLIRYYPLLYLPAQDCGSPESPVVISNPLAYHICTNSLVNVKSQFTHD